MMLKKAYDLGVRAALEKLAKDDGPGLAARMGMGAVPIVGPAISQLVQDPNDQTRGLGALAGQVAGSLGVGLTAPKWMPALAQRSPAFMRAVNRAPHAVGAGAPLLAGALGGALGEGAQSGIEALME